RRPGRLPDAQAPAAAPAAGGRPHGRRRRGPGRLGGRQGVGGTGHRGPERDREGLRDVERRRCPGDGRGGLTGKAYARTTVGCVGVWSARRRAPTWLRSNDGGPG